MYRKKKIGFNFSANYPRCLYFGSVLVQTGHTLAQMYSSHLNGLNGSKIGVIITVKTAEVGGCSSGTTTRRKRRRDKKKCRLSLYICNALKSPYEYCTPARTSNRMGRQDEISSSTIIIKHIL